MDADVIVVGAGNAGLCAAHAARERGARVLVLEKAPRAWAGGNSAFTAGAMRVAHGGLDDRARPRRAPTSRDARDRSLPPYPAEEFLADMARVTLGRGDRDDGPRPRRRLAATLRWMRDRGHPLPADVRAPGLRGRGRALDVLGRARASGTVDGGRGLIDQHAAAAERTGIEIRHDCAVEALERGAVTVRRPRRRARDAARARGRAGRGRLRVQPGAARRLPRPELGRGQGPRHAVQHGRGAAAPRSPPARSRTGTGAAATRSSGTATRRRPAISSSPTASRASPIPSGSSSTPTASASSTRARTSATTPTPSTAPRSCASRSGVAHQVFDAQSLPLLRDDRLRGAGRHARRGRRCASSAEALGIDPERFERTVADFNAAIGPGEFDPAVKDGLRTHGLAVDEDQLGAGDRHAAVRRLPGDVRDHVHLRRRARRRATRACSTSRAARSGPVRGRRAGRRPVLPQLPRRQRPDRGRRLRPPRRLRRGRGRRCRYFAS